MTDTTRVRSLLPSVVASLAAILWVAGARAEETSKVGHDRSTVIVSFDPAVGSGRTLQSERFTVDRGWMLTVDTLRRNDACAQVRIDIAREVAPDAFATGWSLEKGSGDSRVSHDELTLPPGTYAVAIRTSSTAPERCRMSVIVSARRTAPLREEPADPEQVAREADLPNYGRPQAEIDADRAAQDAQLDRLKVGLIERGWGGTIELGTLRLYDWRARYRADQDDLQQVNETDWWGGVYVDYCRQYADGVQERFLTDGKRQQSGEPDGRPFLHTQSESSEQAALRSTVGLVIERAFHEAVGLARTVSFNAMSSGMYMPQPATRSVCMMAAIPFKRVLDVLTSSAMPQYFVQVPSGLSENDPKVRTLPLEAAEILGVPYEQIVVGWDNGANTSSYSCRGLMWADISSVSDCGHPESATITVDIPLDRPSQGGVASKDSVHGPITVDSVLEAVERFLGPGVAVVPLKRSFPSVRVKTKPAKGVIVNGGREWEVLTLDVTISKSDGAVYLSIVADADVASGIGDNAPSEAAFTRRIENEHAKELQEFAERLAVSLSALPP